ncbi:hypothetical protein [Aquimarina macrocephali]|uniref:hypothetical protein n=1 Tax=Aquimarina macrocephali TaxID=666563 RepID=UPI003F6640E0
MDTDLFLERCEEVENGLHKLSNELYFTLNKGVTGKKLDDLISRAKEKVKLFDQLSADIEDRQEKEEIESFKRNINQLRGDILKVEKGV